MKRLLFLFPLLASSLVFSQDPFTAPQRQALDSLATQDVPAKAPGIATAIVQNGQLLYEKYAGYADFKDSSLINHNTRFNIASNGKQFTALAVLLLEAAQQLSLSDDIRQYFPTLFPAIKERMPIQSLLNHTSGIRDCYDLWSLQGLTWWEQSFSNADVLQLLEKQEALNFAPNSQYRYSNSNYILLALLVEKVSGKSFVAFTNEMFRQLNMPHTSFESDYRTIRGPIARAYFNFNTWTTYQWIWNVCGDGNLFTTLADQVQWEKICQGKGLTTISPALIAKSQQPIAGAAFRQYGYGLEFGQYKGMDYVFHEGATGAWKATVTRFPAKATSIITLTNTGKSIPSMQTRQMADVLFGLQADASYLVTKPARVGSYVSEEDIIGTYLTDDDFAFQFEKRADKIFLKRVGRNDVELEREADNIFHQRYDPLFKQEFTRLANGTLQVTAYYINHAPYSLTRQPADFSNVRYESLDGTFMNTETGARLRISYQSGNTYRIQFPGNDEASTGLLVSPGKILVDNYSLHFDSQQAGAAVVFLNGDRIKQVKFSRQP